MLARSIASWLGGGRRGVLCVPVCEGAEGHLQRACAWAAIEPATASSLAPKRSDLLHTARRPAL